MEREGGEKVTVQERERGREREKGGREGGRERLARCHLLFRSLMAGRADPFPRVLPLTPRHVP